MKQTILNLLKLAGFFILSQLPQIPLALMMVKEVPWTLGVILAEFFLILAVVAFFIWYAKRSQLATFSADFMFSRSLGQSLLGFLAIFAVNILFSNLMLYFGGSSTTDNQTAIADMMGNTPIFIMFFIIVVLAPMTEEIMFRAVVPYQLFKGREGLGLTVGVILFGLAHVTTELLSWSTPLYIAMGGVLGYLRYRSNRLEVPLMAHAMYNFMGFCVLTLTN